MTREYTIAKTGRESLDLRFDLVRHIGAAAERNMAVCPERVLTTRRSRFIEQTLLRDQHKRAFGNFSTHDLAFRRRDFANIPPEMNCPCATASFGFPWDRLTQRVIDLENTRPMSKRFQLAAISRWQLFTGDSQKLPDRNVQKNRALFRQVAKILDAMIHFDVPAKLTQISGKRVRNLL